MGLVRPKGGFFPFREELVIPPETPLASNSSRFFTHFLIYGKSSLAEQSTPASGLVEMVLSLLPSGGLGVPIRMHHLHGSQSLNGMRGLLIEDLAASASAVNFTDEDRRGVQIPLRLA